MIKTTIVALTLLGSLVSPSFACDQHGKTGIVDNNSLWIGPDQLIAGGINEAEFNKIMDKVESIYSPKVTELGKTLKVIRKWDDGTVNAYAMQQGKEYQIHMFGGLARHETITSDAMALVACHELGHHLGGAPKKAGWSGNTWASNEGQSDYWGTMKCLRYYFEDDNNVEVVKSLDVDAFATAKCKEQYSDAEEVAVCQRSAAAGLSLGNLFKALRQQTKELKYNTPDPKKVTKTDDNHPDSQCRLDTYFQAALCVKGKDEAVSNTDANVGVCSEAAQDKLGVRPRCWFAPKK